MEEALPYEMRPVMARQFNPVSESSPVPAGITREGGGYRYNTSTRGDGVTNGIDPGEWIIEQGGSRWALPDVVFRDTYRLAPDNPPARGDARVNEMFAEFAAPLRPATGMDHMNERCSQPPRKESHHELMHHHIHDIIGHAARVLAVSADVHPDTCRAETWKSIALLYDSLGLAIDSLRELHGFGVDAPVDPR